MPLRAARLSGIAIIVIGIALLVLSLWASGKALLDPDWLDAQLAAAGPAMQDNPLLQGGALTWVIVIAGVLGLLEAGLSVILGIYTYRARRWAIVTSIVLSVLRLVIVGLLLLLTLMVAALGQQTPTMGRDLLLAGGAAVVLLALIVMLIIALRAPSTCKQTA